MYVALVQHPDNAEYDKSSLKSSVSGGASLPVEVLKGFERAFGVALLEGYGHERDQSCGVVQPPRTRSRRSAPSALHPRCRIPMDRGR